jgi:hypothetical protein
MYTPYELEAFTASEPEPAVELTVVRDAQFPHVEPLEEVAYWISYPVIVFRFLLAAPLQDNVTCPLGSASVAERLNAVGAVCVVGELVVSVLLASAHAE